VIHLNFDTNYQTNGIAEATAKKNVEFYPLDRGGSRVLNILKVGVNTAVRKKNALVWLSKPKEKKKSNFS
jgi:hypothetical protein